MNIENPKNKVEKEKKSMKFYFTDNKDSLYRSPQAIEIKKSGKIEHTYFPCPSSEEEKVLEISKEEALRLLESFNEGELHAYDAYGQEEILHKMIEDLN